MVRSYAHPKFDGLALLEFQAIKPLRAVSDLKVKEESNDEADPVLRSERFRAVAGTSRFCRGIPEVESSRLEREDGQRIWRSTDS